MQRESSGSTRSSSDRAPDESLTTFDVAICGGGLAGLCLARQLRRELPAVRVAVIEPTTRPLPEACHKVGESSVELGSTYLERLGLRDYLHARHLIKNGLRFYPGGGATLPLEARTEIGPVRAPLVTSYQIDRGRLENDLRDMIERDGAQLYEGTRVGGLELGREGKLHELALEGGRAPARLRARWVIDATGRHALLRDKLELTRDVAHGAASCWFRVAERVDVAELVPASAHDWHAHDPVHRRWLSTVHLLGTGYWMWIIPLASGYTSIGIVAHASDHDLARVQTYDDALAWISMHEPVLHARLKDVPAADFLRIAGYSHGVARAWSPDRWATVGEAAAFGDPLYSPGTDFIAYGNTFTVQLIGADLDGDELAPRVEHVERVYRWLCRGAMETVRLAAPVYGHPSAMTAKLYWDNFSYWSMSCQYFIQRIYELDIADQEPYLALGLRFVELHGYVQRVVHHFAKLAPQEPTACFVDVPNFPSVLVDAHTDLLERWSPEQTLARIQERAEQAREIVAEIVLKIVTHLGPGLGRELLDRIEFGSWHDVTISSERLALDHLEGRRRRKTLGAIASDVDRTLANLGVHPQAAAARALFETSSASPRESVGFTPTPTKTRL